MTSCWTSPGRKIPAGPCNYGLTEAGKQALRDTADPSKPHTYAWFVMTDCGAPEEQIHRDLTLEEAVQLYRDSDRPEKRLGVSKDGVATVDLVRSLEWEQQFFDDCRRLESFRDDPVVSKAVETLRQELEQTVPQEDITDGRNVKCEKYRERMAGFLREQYPVGSRIRLTEMGSDPRPIPPGSMGTLRAIDDLGTFHVKWDNGRELGVVIGEDRFTVHPPGAHPAETLYAPDRRLLPPGTSGATRPRRARTWDGRTLLDYENPILGALVKERMPEEKERGLMHWYGKQDSVDSKVRSAVFTVEEKNGQLWGVAECPGGRLSSRRRSWGS